MVDLLFTPLLRLLKKVHGEAAEGPAAFERSHGVGEDDVLLREVKPVHFVEEDDCVGRAKTSLLERRRLSDWQRNAGRNSEWARERASDWARGSEARQLSERRARAAAASESARVYD